MSQRSKHLQTLQGYFRSEKFTDWAYHRLKENNIAFRITKARKAKFGDFKVDASGKITISVNGNLEQDQFILTFLHEYAHFIVYSCYGRRAAPHGKEWKNAFGKLILEHLKFFSLKNKKVLEEFAINPKATGIPIRQDVPIGHDYIKDLKPNDTFIYRNKHYTYISKRRTRVLCTRHDDKKEYLFHIETEVEPTFS